MTYSRACSSQTWWSNTPRHWRHWWRQVSSSAAMTAHASQQPEVDHCWLPSQAQTLAETGNQTAGAERQVTEQLVRLLKAPPADGKWEMEWRCPEVHCPSVQSHIARSALPWRPAGVHVVLLHLWKTLPAVHVDEDRWWKTRPRVHVVENTGWMCDGGVSRRESVPRPHWSKLHLSELEHPGYDVFAPHQTQLQAHTHTHCQKNSSWSRIKVTLAALPRPHTLDSAINHNPN